LQGALGRRVTRWHGRGEVLERGDLAPSLLPEAEAAARPDPEARADAEPEAAARAEHVEEHHQTEERVRGRRGRERREETARARPSGRLGHAARDHRRGGPESGLWAVRKAVKG